MAQASKAAARVWSGLRDDDEANGNALVVQLEAMQIAVADGGHGNAHRAIVRATGSAAESAVDCARVDEFGRDHGG